MDKVEHLLRKKFYRSCTRHDKAETLFCKDCMSDPFCESCLRDSKHRDHELLQVFKASRKEVIRVKDLEKFWNVADVQPFVINAKAVVYIHQRNTKGDPGCCICGGHKLDERYAFCSVECQIVGNKDLNFNKRFRSSDKFVDSRVTSSSSSSSSSGMFATNSSDGTYAMKRSRKRRPNRAPLY